MSSSITGRHDAWRVSNMMFWRVIASAREVGEGLAASPVERQWVARLARLEEETPTFSPDLALTDLFASAAEARFWAGALFRLAELVYQRRLGSQEDQTWQVGTIWAAHGLGVLLDAEARVGDWPVGMEAEQ